MSRRLKVTKRTSISPIIPMTSPAQKIMAQNIEEQLKDLLKKLMSDGTLSDFLKKKMKTIMKQMIREKGEQREAFGSTNAKIDKGKNKVPAP